MAGIGVIGGTTGAVMEVETNSKASRFTPRPIDVGALGSYSALISTGTMAAGLAAAAPVLSFRWGDASRLALIRRVAFAMTSLGTGFTAGIGFVDMIAARSFSASDSGGTALTLTGNNLKRKTAMGSSLVTDLRGASTATLTAGTRTLDANAMAGLRFGVSVATNTVMQPTANIWAPDFSGEWPLVLAQNEGFVLRATVPATGTWTGDFLVEWCEVASFQ